MTPPSPSPSASLERGYRRLVALYPRSFRSENGEEIIAVLMATASPGQVRPGLTESADLVKGAVRMHLGLSRAPMSVVTAVRLMCLGAIGELGVLITVLVTWNSALAAAAARYPQDAASAVRAVSYGFHADMVTLPLAFVMWLLVARGVGRGNQWARLGAFILLVVYSMYLVIDLSEGAAAIAPAGLIASGVVWVIGLVAICFLCRQQSWPYFEPKGGTVPKHEVPL